MRLRSSPGRSRNLKAWDGMPQVLISGYTFIDRLGLMAFSPSRFGGTTGDSAQGGIKSRLEILKSNRVDLFDRQVVRYTPGQQGRDNEKNCPQGRQAQVYESSRRNLNLNQMPVG